MTSTNSRPIWVDAEDDAEAPFALFDGPSDEGFARTERSCRRSAPSSREPRPFERLLGTLSLADLNEYREAAGREPELDAKALRALHEAADRFFPRRTERSGSDFLRNTYLKYMSEHADLAEIAAGGEQRFKDV